MNSLLLAVLFFTTKTRLSQTQHPTDHNIDVLVQTSRLVNECTGGSACGTLQDLTVVIDSKQYELKGTNYSSDLLRTGKYKAGILKDEHNHPYEYQLIYEFIFSDGKTLSYQVVREGA